MRKRTVTKTHTSNGRTAAIAPLPWSYLLVLAICGCVLASGFFLAARQHFMSMDLGMQNSKLRKQLEDLESENRRLLLAREVSLSPAEITRTARTFGFHEINPGADIVPITAAVPTARPVQANNTPKTSSAVALTAYQRPVGQPEAAKRASEPAKQKMIKPELTAMARR